MVNTIVSILLLQNIVLTKFLGIGIIIKEKIDKPYLYNLLFLILTIIISIPLYFIRLNFIPEFIRYVLYIVVILIVLSLIELLIKITLRKPYPLIKESYYYLYINSAIYGIIIINLINKIKFSKYLLNITLYTVSFVFIYLILELNKNKLSSKHSLSIKLIMMGVLSLLFSRFLI